MKPQIGFSQVVHFAVAMALQFGVQPKKTSELQATPTATYRYLGGLYVPCGQPSVAVVKVEQPETFDLFDSHMRTTGGVRQKDRDDPFADQEDSAHDGAPRVASDGVQANEYDEAVYRSPLKNVASAALRKTTENLLGKINSHTDGLHNFHGIIDRQARVEHAFLNLGKQIGYEHVQGIYVYNNTDVHYDHNGHETLSGCVLMLHENAPIGPLASLAWGRHRAVGMLKDASKATVTIAAGSCATMAADSGVRFVDGANIAPEHAIEIEKTSHRPVLGCGGGVSCGGSFNMDSAISGLTPTFVVTNHSTAAVAQVELALDMHPRITVGQFFRDRMYGTAVARGQQQTLRMLELIGTKSVTVNYLAPMTYIRRVATDDMAEGEHLYAVYIDMFGPTDHMLPSSTLAHHVRERTQHFHVGYTVDGGSQVGYLVYTPNMPVTYPDLSGLIVHGDLEVYKNDPQRGRLPDDDYGALNYGLPTRVFFSDIQKTVIDRDIRTYSTSRIMPHQCSKALVIGRHQFKDQHDADFHSIATTAFNSLYSSTLYTLALQIKSESHYVSGLCFHRCKDRALARAVHGPSTITVPATNAWMWDMVHELLRLAALESAGTDKSKSLYDDVPESLAVYHKHQLTLSYAWVMAAREKYNVTCPTTNRNRPHHSHTSAMAVHIAEQFTAGDEAAHLAQYLSRKTTDEV